MPICHFEQINENIAWGMWDIQEQEEELLERYAYRKENVELAAIKPPLRRKQWLTGRLLLKEITHVQGIPFEGVFKDEFAKAWLRGNNHHISIAHAENLALAIFNKKESTGIDVEKVRPRIIDIAKKFMHPEEVKLAGNDAEELTIYWCAKEALYKQYGRKQVFFKSELRVYRQPGDRDFTGVILKEDYTKEVSLRLHRVGEYMVVYAC